MPFQVKCHNCDAILYTEENSKFTSWGTNAICAPVTNWLDKNLPKHCPRCNCLLASIPLKVEVKPLESFRWTLKRVRRKQQNKNRERKM